MKAVLISIQPKWCELIASGKKTIEVRKTRPKIETPFKGYIYETKGATETPWVDEEGHFIFKGRGEVIGEFVCNRIDKECLTKSDFIDTVSITLKETFISLNELSKYLGADGILGIFEFYAWHISALKIYDKPKELGEFVPTCKYQGERCDICVFNEEAFGGCCRILTRPPKSWCYVEQLGE